MGADLKLASQASQGLRMQGSQESGRQGKRDGFGNSGSESLWKKLQGFYFQGEFQTSAGKVAPW